MRGWIWSPSSSTAEATTNFTTVTTLAIVFGARPAADRIPTGFSAAAQTCYIDRLELLTVTEVCAILRCHEKTLYRWVER
jgi:hypothetical protein